MTRSTPHESYARYHFTFCQRRSHLGSASKLWVFILVSYETGGESVVFVNMTRPIIQSVMKLTSIDSGNSVKRDHRSLISVLSGNHHMTTYHAKQSLLHSVLCCNLPYIVRRSPGQNFLEQSNYHLWIVRCSAFVFDTKGSVFHSGSTFLLAG